MKILFISKGDLPDFQSDMILHGGRSIFGDNFVDANKVWYMYSDDKKLYWNSRVPENGKSYGRGFTLYGLFETDNINRDNIEDKIKSHYFDKIIYGSCTRCLDYIDSVLTYYNKSDIIFIDGEDTQRIRRDLAEISCYYKREIVSEDLDVATPIHFAIPKSLILDYVPIKTREYATIIPGDISTYIYDNQEDYYNGYKESYFGITFKKGGWDCLRHYEILMNGCIPYFPDLENCPAQTMKSFPKQIILECNEKLKKGELTEIECQNYISKLLDYSKENLTTEKLINYVLNK